MNIIKIQDQLKSVPDNTLVGYVQNPTGQVPTYLALSELQRRKEMRSKYQANKPEDKIINGVRYLNDGDWVENCSYIVYSNNKLTLCYQNN